MDRKTEIKEFLASRRARLGPEQAGLPAYGSRKRRVPGLRREEVAMLAGVSVDYYTRLERGNLAGVSEPVLDSLARALKLDEAERTHLFDLARAANEAGSSSRPRMSSQRVRPSVQRMLDSMVGAPAWVRNARQKVAIETAFAVVRDGGVVSRVGAPQYSDVPMDFGVFLRNVTLTGGVAPARAYIDELLPDVLEGKIQPGLVFDRTVSLDEVSSGYRAMAARTALKVLVQP